MKIQRYLDEADEQFAEQFTEIVTTENGGHVRALKQQIYWQDLEKFVHRKMKEMARLISSDHKRKIRQALEKLDVAEI